MLKNRFLRSIFCLLILSSAWFALPQQLYAGIYNSDTDVTYKEYWIPHSQFTGGFVDHDRNTCINSSSGNSWYLEPWPCPKTLTFTIPDDFSQALKIEIYLDLWRNHDNLSARFKLNEHNTVFTPNVGNDWSRSPYIAEIPKNYLVQGQNTITLWHAAGGYHIHDIAFRIYFDDANPLRDASGTPIVAPAGQLLTVGGINAQTGGAVDVDSDQLVLTAQVDTNAKFTEFHAYYDGYDEDNDGVSRDWHSRTRNNWHPGGTDAKPLGGTIDHIGTIATPTAGTYSTTWDLRHVMNQSGVKFKVRIVDAGDVVREAAGGVSADFTLLRSRPMAAFTVPNFVDKVLHHSNTNVPHYPDVWTQNINVGVNPANYSTAYLLGSFWENPNIAVNGGSSFRAFRGSEDDWALSIRELSTASLQQGTNQITYSWSGGFGQFIEQPGPLIVLKQTSGAVVDNQPPTLTQQAPAPGATNVAPASSILLHLTESGLGVDITSIQMRVNGGHVTPQISGFSNDYSLLYTPPSGFPPESTVTVAVDMCDLASNCTSEQYTFTTKALDVIAPLILNPICIAGTEGATITWDTDEPTIGTVNYGFSSAYTADVTDNVLATQHVVQLTGLAAESVIHYQIVAVDGSGNSAQSDDIVCAPIGESTLQSDDFNSCKLDTERWVYIDPQANSAGATSLTATGTAVSFAVPEGIAHDVWTSGNKAPRLMQPTANTDFTIEVKFDSEIGEAYQLQGVLIEQDDENFLRLNFQSNPNDSYTLYGFKFVDGVPQSVISVALPNGQAPMYLQVIRTGIRWEVLYSFDNIDWIAGGTFSHALAVSSVGVFAGNAGRSPAHTAVVDYFFNDATRIDPEDATALYLEKLAVSPANVGVATSQPVTPTSGAPADCGNPIRLVATPQPGWSFDRWVSTFDSATGVDNPLITDFTFNEVITATFTQDEYTVMTDTVGSGVVSYTPQSATYLYSDTISFTANPAVGWEFAGWSGALSGSANPAELQIVGNSVVTATFTAIPYTLDTTVIGRGAITASPEQDAYIYGDEVSLLATPIPGWSFTGWDGDATGVENPLLITVTGNTAVSAIFTKDAYSLDTTVSGGGTISRNPDQPTYEYGDQVTLNVTTDTGWEFVRWSGAITSTVNPTTITMQGNVAVTAVLTKTRHSLTDAVIGNGSLLITPEQSVYLYGDEVTVTAVPAAGWTLENWSGDASGKANPITLVMDGNKSIVATFVEAPFTLTTTVTGEGAVERSPALESFKDGDTVVLTAVAAPGWSFTGWSGAASGTENPLTITMDSDKTVSANFVQDAYTVAVDVQSAISNTNPAGNTVTLTPEQATYTYGAAVTVSAVAADGWTFARWSGALSGTQPVVPMTVTSDLEITAIFTPTLYTLDYKVVGGQGGEGGRIEASKDGPYIHGEVITLTAVADDGYVFAEWLIEDPQAAGVSAADPQITVTIPDNRTFRARFVEAANKIFLPFLTR